MTSIPPVGSTTAQTPTTATSGADASAALAPGGAMGEDQFLQLLVTQLKNQDPLNPLQGSDFAAQLAQFSSLEQLTQINQSLQGQTSSNAGLSGSINTSLAASLIGKQVVATGNQVDIPASGSAQVTVDVGGTGGVATVTVTDANGQTVDTENVGYVASGRQTLSWQPPAGMTPGAYTYQVSVTGSDGSQAPVTTYTSGTVTGLHFTSNGVELAAGDLTIDLDNLTDVQTGAASGAGTSLNSLSPLLSQLGAF